MGNGIAQVFARAGIEVGLVDVDPKTLDRAVGRIECGLRTLVEVGSICEKEVAPILGRIRTSTDLEAMARDVDFALEAVVEVPTVKKEIFSCLEAFCPEGTVIASNTSSLDVFGSPRSGTRNAWSLPTGLRRLTSSPWSRCSPARKRPRKS